MITGCDLQVTKVTVNDEIPAERFKLEQPAGQEVIHVAGQKTGKNNPGQESKPQGTKP